MIIINQKSPKENARQPSDYYRVAGHTLVTDTPLAELAAFKSEAPTPSSPTPVPRLDQDRTQVQPDILRQTYCGPGWIGGQWRQVACQVDNHGYLLDVSGAGKILITTDSQQITLLSADPDVQNNIIVESILGPALILALALQNTWCLHASAAVYGNHLVAFTGESGNGKSTLAAFLTASNPTDRHSGNWRLIADDILPISFEQEEIIAKPHFPQLKIPPREQPSQSEPERMRIAVVYVIQKPSPTQKDVNIIELNPREAALSLVRHTVASRLFAKDLLAQHLEFCSKAARSTPVRKLNYPHNYDHLCQVRQTILDDISSL